MTLWNTSLAMFASNCETPVKQHEPSQAKPAKLATLKIISATFFHVFEVLKFSRTKEFELRRHMWKRRGVIIGKQMLDDHGEDEKQMWDEGLRCADTCT